MPTNEEILNSFELYTKRIFLNYNIQIVTENTTMIDISDIETRIIFNKLSWEVTLYYYDVIWTHVMKRLIDLCSFSMFQNNHIWLLADIRNNYNKNKKQINEYLNWKD